IVVHSEFIGGDFGGKGLSLDEYMCYFLARATGRPVKAVMTYADELGAANPRHAATIHLRTAVDAGGHFLAHESTALLDGGAYAAGKPLPLLTVPAHMSLSAYHVPQARLEVTVVYTTRFRVDTTAPQVTCRRRSPARVTSTSLRGSWTSIRSSSDCAMWFALDCRTWRDMRLAPRAAPMC
ncbi:MAG: molybdopterin-dependent oxidoreductase, partial [Chloroflexi bacterium]|nr:molybdopterin-dependent oxidoreductase [Chloroflexota bacterium]